MEWKNPKPEHADLTRLSHYRWQRICWALHAAVTVFLDGNLRTAIAAVKRGQGSESRTQFAAQYAWTVTPFSVSAHRAGRFMRAELPSPSTSCNGTITMALTEDVTDRAFAA
jgi:hypothetical protein